jgi:prophage tail gpP-like protein
MTPDVRKDSRGLGPPRTGWKEGGVAPRVLLEVVGEQYGGWTKITIRRGLEQLAGTFDLEVTERWPGQIIERPILEGQECRVLVDGIPVITGYVDDVKVSYDKASHSVSITGRDKTCDLVDCCPPSTQMHSADFITFAKKLCAPFGIEVAAECDPGHAAPVKNNEGDTVFECLEQQARARGVLLTTDGQGRLVITRLGAKRAGRGFALGDNVRKADASFSMKERFSEYTVKAQSGCTDAFWKGKAAAHGKGTAKDSGVTRHRPLTIVAEQDAQGTAQRRVQHDCNQRYGKSRQVTYTVYGWYGNGVLWEPGQQADIDDAFAKIDATWVIGSVAWLLDDQGWRSEVMLCPKEAFDVEPPKTAKGKGEGGFWK